MVVERKFVQVEAARDRAPIITIQIDGAIGLNVGGGAAALVDLELVDQERIRDPQITRRDDLFRDARLASVEGQPRVVPDEIGVEFDVELLIVILDLRDLDNLDVDLDARRMRRGLLQVFFAGRCRRFEDGRRCKMRFP